MKVKILFLFLSETINAVTIKFTNIMGTYFTMLKLLFHNAIFIITTVFPLLCEPLYAGHTELFEEAQQGLSTMSLSLLLK